MSDDIVIILSENMIRVALQSYAAMHFNDQLFPLGDGTFSLLGKDIGLIIEEDKAFLDISLLGQFQVKNWKLIKRQAHLSAKVQISFDVRDNQLFMQIKEGSIQVQGAEFIEKVATSLVSGLIKQVFSKSLIRLPIQIDISTPHAESNDETHLKLGSISLQPGSLRIAFVMAPTLVPYPEPFQQETLGSQRSRAMNLTMIGIEARRAGYAGRAARLFLKVVTEADPSYEVGWLWLSKVVKGSTERKFCLQRAIQINPSNSQALRELETLSNIQAVMPQQNDYDEFS